LNEELIDKISEEILEIVDKYELSISEVKVIGCNMINVMEDIAIIAKNRRYPRDCR
jgi:hypothetical protein